AVGTLPAAGPFPTTPPTPPAGGGGVLGNLTPSVRNAALSTFVYLNQEAIVPIYYPFGHPMLGWTIRSVSSMYLPTTTLNLPLFDNRSAAGKGRTMGQGGCGEQLGNIDTSSTEHQTAGQSANQGACEEGAAQ